MRIFISGLLILLTGCHSSINKRNAITNKHQHISVVDNSSKIRSVYPIFVEYTSATNSDSMYFYIDNNKLLITPKGHVTNKTELVFEIHPEGNIQKLYPFILENDIVLIYSFSTHDGESGSFAKRISLKQKEILWKTPIDGFSLATPILLGNYTYISTLGFVGKLNILSGKFEWQFDVFFKNGNFINFNEPVFYKDSTVLFTEKNPVSTKGCSILIDDRNSRILKIKR